MSAVPPARVTPVCYRIYTLWHTPARGGCARRMKQLIHSASAFTALCTLTERPWDVSVRTGKLLPPSDLNANSVISHNICHTYTKEMAMTQPRQNFHAECEAGINKQINLELYASYVYQSMAWHFDRDDVAMPGFHGYFKKKSGEEREHAEKLMKYQNKRGGRIVLQAIQKPDREEWGTGLDAMKAALNLEKNVNQSLLDLHGLASQQNDPQMTDFLEGEYLEEQVNDLKEISDHITNLKRVGPGLGEYTYDHESL